MRLVTYSLGTRTSIGAVVDDGVVDIAGCVIDAAPTMLALLQQGEAALDRVRELLARNQFSHPLARLRLHAPVPRPGKYLAAGLNYALHAEEARRKGIPTPKHQVWFNKQTTCVTGPYDDVHLPKVSDKLDYEAELAFVIGRRCRHVPAERAAGVIAGYTIANDLSVRDWQMRAQTWTLGKSFDTHGPLGPWLVTGDEIVDPQDLDIRCLVNGELRQSSNTSDMIHTCADMVAHLSRAMTLEPGDVFATGTPAGIGSAMEPPRYLAAGDVVRVEIEKIGHIENRVIPEP